MQTVNLLKNINELVMQNLDGYLNSVLKFGDEGNPELDDSDLYDILLKYDDVIDGYYTIPRKDQTIEILFGRIKSQDIDIEIDYNNRVLVGNNEDTLSAFVSKGAKIIPSSGFLEGLNFGASKTRDEIQTILPTDEEFTQLRQALQFMNVGFSASLEEDNSYLVRIEDKYNITAIALAGARFNRSSMYIQECFPEKAI